MLRLTDTERRKMSITIEAIYEAGVLKPLSSLPDLKEREKVRITVEATGAIERRVGVIDEQRRNRIQIDGRAAREIGDSHEYDLVES